MAGAAPRKKREKSADPDVVEVEAEGGRTGRFGDLRGGTQQLAAETRPETGVIELAVGGTRIYVRGHIEGEALTRVFDVLEARRGSRRRCGSSSACRRKTCDAASMGSRWLPSR